MLIVAIIIWLLSHHGSHVHWAIDTWAWMSHHVVITILILILGG